MAATILKTPNIERFGKVWNYCLPMVMPPVPFLFSRLGRVYEWQFTARHGLTQIEGAKFRGTDWKNFEPALPNCLPRSYKHYLDQKMLTLPEGFWKKMGILPFSLARCAFAAGAWSRHSLPTDHGLILTVEGGMKRARPIAEGIFAFQQPTMKRLSERRNAPFLWSWQKETSALFGTKDSPFWRYLSFCYAVSLSDYQTT